MDNILMTLQEFNFSELRKKPFTGEGYTKKEIEKLNELDDYTKDYLSTRPLNLATVTRAMQVALEDEEIGTFDRKQALSMSYYLESEIKALDHIISRREDVLYHLKEAEKAKGDK